MFTPLFIYFFIGQIDTRDVWVTVFALVSTVGAHCFLLTNINPNCCILWWCNSKCSKRRMQILICFIWELYKELTKNWSMKGQFWYSRDSSVFDYFLAWTRNCLDSPVVSKQLVQQKILVFTLQFLYGLKKTNVFPPVPSSYSPYSQETVIYLLI